MKKIITKANKQRNNGIIKDMRINVCVFEKRALKKRPCRAIIKVLRMMWLFGRYSV